MLKMVWRDALCETKLVRDAGDYLGIHERRYYFTALGQDTR